MATGTSQRASSGDLLKRILVGRAMPSHRLEHTLLPKILALPVFSSDPLSSNAYATEEALAVLLVTSATAAHLVMPITVVIVIVLTIVITSYRQTVRAYPSGGGAYIVSKENLGTLPGLIAAAALLTDYVLTVSVSVVAGVVAITSAAPSLAEHKVALSLAFVAFITLANLRGVRESGTLFAVPTYSFVLSIYVMLAFGFAQCVLSGCPQAEPVAPLPELAAGAGSVGLFVILRAFASGSTALTGVEAISNGVPAFRRPAARNAAATLGMMGFMTISMFLGISFLATRADVTVSEERSVVAQIAHAVFNGGIGFYVVQFFTAAILILAANTSYQDFPRLSSILARDRFMPRQFMNRGDRLVFSNGVIVLAVLASILIYVFDANLTRLIQLYVVGVFTSFTFSQSGMVKHWLKEKHKGPEAARGWQRSIVINAIGATATGVVLVVITATKFVHGAWIVIAAMPVFVLMFEAIRRHYESALRQLRRGTVRAGDFGVNHVVLVIRDLDAAAAEAVGVVRSMRPAGKLRVVHPVPRGGSVAPELQERWRSFSMGAPDLEPLPMNGGGLLESVRGYARGIERAPDDFVNVVIPEVVRGGLTAYFIRRYALVRLKAGLLRESNIVVTDVPVRVEGGRPVGVDARPLIPTRTVALLFVSSVNDATIRAANYAEALDASETRAIYFDLDPEAAHRMQEEWGEQGMRIPLDIVETPFRDLTGPMVDEVRRFTARPDTLVLVVIPEFIVRKWRHLLLHNQNALFVKRLFLFEPNVVLSSVPFPLEKV